MLKKAHLLRSPHPSSLQRTDKYASLLSPAKGGIREPCIWAFLSILGKTNFSAACKATSGLRVWIEALSLLKWQVTAGYDPFPLPPAKASLKPFKFKEQTTLTA
jgi:hypothetical protein